MLVAVSGTKQGKTGWYTKGNRTDLVIYCEFANPYMYEPKRNIFLTPSCRQVITTKRMGNGTY
jgi:hypothetical protein